MRKKSNVQTVVNSDPRTRAHVVRKAGPFGESFFISGTSSYIPPGGMSDAPKSSRGINVYTTSQVLAATGRNIDGSLSSFGVEQPYFHLTIQQRNDIFRLSAPVNGLVTKRMNYIASKEIEITPIHHEEDKIYEEMKNLYQIFNEYKTATDIKYVVAKARIVGKLCESLPDLLPDMSNFMGAVTRWRKNNKHTSMTKCDEIQEWLREPHQGMLFQDWIKKVVYDLHIHGSASIYKKKNEINKIIEDFDSLPGGTVYKLKDRYFSSVYGFVQIVAGYEPQMFFSDEMCYMEWLPTSVQSHSFIPLESLINAIAEDMLFQRQMADFADGTKPPEKIVIVTNPNDPFSDPERQQDVPLPGDEQRRLENKLNAPRQFPVITMSGNDAKVLDISKENTMSLHTQRQRDIRELVGFVFGASNLEMSLSGSASTNGRDSSDNQAEMAFEMGTKPVMDIIGQRITHDILPYRFGYGYKLVFKQHKNDRAEAELNQIRLNNGEVTVNELRELDGQHLFEGKEYDLPKGAGGPAQQPDGSTTSPFNMRAM